MGIFCEELVEKELVPPVTGKCYTPNELFYKVVGREFLSEQEGIELESFFMHLVSGEGLINLMDIIMERDLDVIISDALQEMKTVEYPVNPFPTKDGRVLILGQYEPKQKHITLFIKGIRFAADKSRISSSYLLQAVFAHELYHAYFQKNKYVPEIEEPLAEFGSLIYMRILFKEDRNDIEALLKMIKNKKTLQCLQYYSLGGTLFHHLLIDSSIIKAIVSFKFFDLSRLLSGGDKENEFKVYKQNPDVESLLSLLC